MNTLNPVTVTLVDFLPLKNKIDSFSFVMENLEKLGSKLREKHFVPFSNRFELTSTINCRQFFGDFFEIAFDVKLSRSCSCLVANTKYSFLIIDRVTNFKSVLIPHKQVYYFTIEENYNQRGFDALIFHNFTTLKKYDLREFIERKGKSTD